MIKSNKDGDLIVISGPSGVGKDTLVGKIICDNKKLSVSATTREKREHEVNGVDYHFLSKDDFKEKIQNNEFIEYALVHSSDYYGTLKSEVEENLKKGIDVILVIDIKGALNIKEQYPSSICIFLLPPSVEELKKRLIERNTEKLDSLLRRFTSMYKEINEITKYNYVVVNDSIENAVNKINAILLSEKCRVDRIEDLEIDTKEEDIHESLIEYFDSLEKK